MRTIVVSIEYSHILRTGAPQLHVGTADAKASQGKYKGIIRNHRTKNHIHTIHHLHIKNTSNSNTATIEHQCLQLQHVHRVQQIILFFIYAFHI